MCASLTRPTKQELTPCLINVTKTFCLIFYLKLFFIPLNLREREIGENFLLRVLKNKYKSLV